MKLALAKKALSGLGLRDLEKVADHHAVMIREYEHEKSVLESMQSLKMAHTAVSVLAGAKASEMFVSDTDKTRGKVIRLRR
jgi:hypothetical protein